MLLIIPLFIGTTEIVLIAALILLLFGGKKFPEMMKGLGQGMQAFKKGMNDPMPEDTSKAKEAEEERTENAHIQEPENNDTKK
jgi:sec-independent protein translocase protein TatA